MGYVTVRIHLHNATDLPAADFSLLGGKSDPYVIFSLGVHQARSTCVRGSLNPVWHHAHFELTVDQNRYDTAQLSVNVWDNDKMRKDDLLGTVSIPIKSIARTNASSQAYDIELQEGYSNCQPKIHMTLEVLNETDAANELFCTVWENERYGSSSTFNILQRKWSTDNLKQTNGDPKRWSCSPSSLLDKAADSDKFDDVAPPMPPSYVEDEAWHYVQTAGDRDGWVYASSFDGPWFEEAAPLCYVRRRKWIRVLRRQA